MKKKSNLPDQEQITHIIADADTGLTDEQVLDRIIAGQSNLPVEPPSKTVWQIIASNLFTYFNLIFFVLAGCVIAAGSYNDLLFLPIVFANILIGTVQEINAKRTLDRLQLINSPKAMVVREGREVVTTVENLVVDDIAVFSAGDQVGADAEVVAGEAAVNESLVTGESDEITKKAGDELLSGSFIISGKCRARLIRVGHESFVSKLTLDAKKAKKRKKVGMMKSLTNLIMAIGVIIIPVGVCLFFSQMYRSGLSWQDAVVKTTAALIGMIPEGLYLLTSVALAVSVVRLAKKKTLVHELDCIETLARVDVLCVDKTGTITENEMKVTDIVPVNASLSDMENILSDITGSMEADNATMTALKARFAGKSRRSALTVIPFSSAYKYSGAVMAKGESYVIGAPEFVLKAQYRAYKEKVEKLAGAGSRVLVLGITGSELAGGELPANIQPLGFILLENPIRPAAKETFGYFSEQGVAVKVISGDNPVTVAHAASEAGIIGSESYIDASTLTNDDMLADAAERYTVFGRVTPEQKRKLIRALKEEGHKVAMTGDGVNDVLALKEADCSIAMASGSDVASQVSQLVLLDSDFSAMPSVVAEGRRVINNIERSAALFLVKNIFSFIMAWVTILAALEYPLEPSQLSLVNTFTIGIPSFILALEPNTAIVHGAFLRNVMFRAFPAGLTDFILIMGAQLFSMAFLEIGSAEVSTISAILMGVVGLVMLYKVCQPFNRLRRLLFGLMCVGFVASLLAFGEKFFSMTALGFGAILVTVTLALLAPPVMSSISKVFDAVGGLFGSIKKRFSGAEAEDADR